ncbi:1-deoxy-D-xylulose-5-phosphate reductoisomerase [Thermoleophilia bacterium SCSIO 60948]|nr:1-deoxy-D-xylulose-5-phosphate reductoisomerase [Thermoleophilia bacterium SCSIO 60948]
MPKRVLILGSTGSVGEQAIAVAQSTDELDVVGLSAATSWERLAEQADALGVGSVALSDPASAARAASALGAETTVDAGEDGVRELIARTSPDLVLNAIVGSAGLGPTVATLSAGIDLALANKESLVVGGELVTMLAEATGARILPVDSEHSALAQLIDGEGPGAVERLVLTASGGPFRGRDDLSGVSVSDALDHPTWAMGGRITIDSATLMNKGFEVIEAHHLFRTPFERIDVVVHPQSLIHALIDLCDGATLAHLGVPDMRTPIAWAMHHPDRAALGIERLDLSATRRLDFEPPDVERFPCLALARRAGIEGGTAPCVLNAADEVAVEAFLDGRIEFTRIPELVEAALEEIAPQPVTHFSELFEIDARARDAVRGRIDAGAVAR